MLIRSRRAAAPAMATALVMVLVLSAGLAQAKGPVNANEAATARYFSQLVSGPDAQQSALTLFFSQMPKGGDLHHHYSGALYAEQYVDFLDKQGLCVNKTSYRIETDKQVVAAERALPAGQRTCLSSSELYADDQAYREVLQRWSSKDFNNHGAIQPPPDRQFFQTFGFFGPVSNDNFAEGLQTLKQRAIAENVSYIETMFKLAPFKGDAAFDQRAWQAGNNDAALDALLREQLAALDQDTPFNNGVKDYVSKIAQAAAGIDDANFTMRYQAYVLRLLGPSQVFSSMVAGFKAVRQSELIVGVNIVGQESQMVSMRDYDLHMKMFRFLKKQFPDVKVALHAGELALGDVPPEGLKFHIDEAVNVGMADRIGHGIDLAHERNALALMKKMKADNIPVEINLTSNGFISGISGANHPVTVYRKFGVPFVIATDDAGVTRHDLSHEYTLFASRYRPDYAEVKRLSYDSVRYAFLPEAHKQRLARQLDVRFARFEADMASLAASTGVSRKAAPIVTKRR